jgi:membrane-associated HD superfamily phosphohydrolase
MSKEKQTKEKSECLIEAPQILRYYLNTEEMCLGALDYSEPHYIYLKNALEPASINALKNLVKDTKSDPTAGLESNEHENTRQHITEKIDELAKNLAKKEDIIDSKEEIIKTIRAESNEIKACLEEKIIALETHLSRFLPYKRMFRGSFYGLIFFFTSIFLTVFLALLLLKDFGPGWGCVYQQDF